jgi:hypothetical protein
MGSVYKRTWKDSKGRKHKSSVWWIKYYRNGRAFRESSESTKEGDAKRLLRIREGHIAEGMFTGLEPEKVRYEELEQDLLNDYKINERKSRKMVTHNLKHLRKYFEGAKVKHITSDKIRSYITWRKQQKTHYKRPPSNATINRELSAHTTGRYSSVDL